MKDYNNPTEEETRGCFLLTALIITSIAVGLIYIAICVIIALAGK